MTLPFFIASLSAWRAAHAPTPRARASRELPAGVVKLSIKAVQGARSAATLGAEREGTGAVIGEDGLILTIGYLIIESGSIIVMAADGQMYPATVVGFDHVTGFGLLRANPAVARRPLALGDSSAVRELHTVRIATHPAAGGGSTACVVARRRFVGYWEYLIDEAIFTAPPRFDHSGAALLDAAGRLVGIGSLWVGDALELGVAFPGNMFVPVDLLKPLLTDLVANGRRAEPARPWLGVYSEELEKHVVITQVLAGSPAEKGGLRRGDIVLGVGGEPIASQAEFYQKVWGSGPAGAEIRLHVLQANVVRALTLRSVDRLDYLRPWRVR